MNNFVVFPIASVTVLTAEGAVVVTRAILALAPARPRCALKIVPERFCQTRTLVKTKQRHQLARPCSMMMQTPYSP
jgi:hypothetical protein